MLMWLMNLDFAGGDGAVDVVRPPKGMLAAKNVRRRMRRGRR